MRALLLACTLSLAACARPATEPPAPARSIARFELEREACASCLTGVRGALEGVAGVGEVDLRIGRRDFTVAFDPARISEDQLRTALEDAGLELARAPAGGATPR